MDIDFEHWSLFSNQSEQKEITEKASILTYTSYVKKVKHQKGNRFVNAIEQGWRTHGTCATSGTYEKF